MSNDFRVDVKHPSKSKRHQWSFGKKLAAGGRSSGNIRKKTCRISRGSEYFPLMSDDNTTDDEEEEEIVTVHDSSIFRLRQRNSPSRRLPEPSEPDDDHHRNGGGESELAAAAKTGVNGFKNDLNSKADPFLNREMITVKMKDGDTLQSVALKYRCSISDIKRANNLISDQDFHALPHLKVPVRKHGILSQPVSPGESRNHRCEEGNNNVRVINLGVMLSNNSPQDAAEFLKRMDEDLVKIVLNTKSQKDSLEDGGISAAAASSSSALRDPGIQPALVKDPYVNPYIICNIHWSYVLFFLVIISIVSVVIIFYINYMRTSHNSTQQNQVFSGVDHFSSSPKTASGS